MTAEALSKVIVKGMEEKKSFGYFSYGSKKNKKIR